MKALLLAVFVLMFTALQATASNRTATCFLDGAKIEYESVYTNGCLELSLPGGFIKDSLRIKPVGDTTIQRVEIRRVGTDRMKENEIAILTEQKVLLADKIKALDARERIFTAAAKSQSGRALRRTKTNPDPLTEVRKGTAFAVSQLESVFARKREYEKDLADLNTKLSTLRTVKDTEHEVCYIWFSKKSGRTRISYLNSDINWKPIYDFRLDGKGQVRMVMRALFNTWEKDSTFFVIDGKISDASYDSIIPTYVAKQYDKVEEYIFPIENQVLSQVPVNSLSFSFINGSGRKFSPGDASCYLQGEYIGGFSFRGAAPKESVTLAAGKLSVR